MKSLVIKDAQGNVINIGLWDYKMVPIMGDDTDKPLMVDDLCKPIRNSKEHVVGYEPKVGGYEQKQVGERAANPLPDGAHEDQSDIVDGSDGGKYSANDYRALRRAEYPSIGDQLDALFKAGAYPPDMAAKVAAVKSKYPKT